MPLLRTTRLAVCATLAIVTPLASAQLLPKKQHGTMHFQTRVGSFKILGVNNEPAEGRIEVSFTGSVLVSGTPKVKVEGNVRKEYENKAKQRVVYHGKGKITVEGRFWSIQWFGRDLKASWDGFGIVRLYGEYDKQLKTGELWYADRPQEVFEWGTNGLEKTNPPQRLPAGPTPTPRARRR